MTDDDQTALNIALASEKVWFGKMLTAQRERDEAKAEITALKRVLDEILLANDELQRRYRRLESKHDAQETRLVLAGIVRKHIDPFLPKFLQDTERRASNEALYAAAAELAKDLRPL